MRTANATTANASNADDPESMVIARAFGDEPVAMEIIEKTDTYVAVRRPGTKGFIRLRRSDIYEYSHDVFVALSALHTSGNTTALAEKWSDGSICRHLQ